MKLLRFLAINAKPIALIVLLTCVGGIFGHPFIGLAIALIIISIAHLFF